MIKVEIKVDSDDQVNIIRRGSDYEDVAYLLVTALAHLSVKSPRLDAVVEAAYRTLAETPRDPS